MHITIDMHRVPGMCEHVVDDVHRGDGHHDDVGYGHASVPTDG